MTPRFPRIVFRATLFALACWALCGSAPETALEQDSDESAWKLECGESSPANDALPVQDAFLLQRGSFEKLRTDRIAGAFRTRGGLPGEGLGAAARFEQIVARRGPYAPRPLHLAICIWRT